MSYRCTPLLYLLTAPVFAVALLLATGATRAAAQDASTFIAVPDAFPAIDAKAIVVREPGRDIVVLHPDEVNPQTLSFALQTLHRAREEHPRLTRGQMIPITGFVAVAPMADATRLVLQRVLARLGARPVTRVGPFGLGRWMAWRSSELAASR